MSVTRTLRRRPFIFLYTQTMREMVTAATRIAAMMPDPPAAIVSATGSFETRTAATPPSAANPMIPTFKQARITPLNVDAQRHDRGDQAQVENCKCKRWALDHAHGDKQDGHKRKERRNSNTVAHTDCPLKIPVGRTRSTTTRMTKDTANLYSVDSNCTRPSGTLSPGMT
jgi:hypothetical protein